METFGTKCYIFLQVLLARYMVSYLVDFCIILVAKSCLFFVKIKQNNIFRDIIRYAKKRDRLFKNSYL
jgi:hypothetical protein